MDDNRDNNPTSPQPDPEPSTPRTSTAWNTLEGRVISLVSRKGGVGKTTSAVNLGAALALSGHTVLIIGTDPQCGVCRTLGMDQHDLDTSLGDIFSKNTPLTELAQPSPLESLFFVSPRIDSLNDEEAFLANMELRAEDFVREVDRARNLYDTILIDCPPSLGSSTRAALLASDSFLVPVQAEELCRSSLNPLMEFVADFRSRHFPAATTSNPQLEGLFLTMVSNRTRMSRHVSAQVGEEYGAMLLDHSVPRTTRLSEMALKGKPAVIYARKSAGSRAYFDLADELMQRFSKQSAHEHAGAGLAEEDLPDTQPATVGTSVAPDEATTVSHPRPAATGLERLLAELGHTNDLIPRQAPAQEPAGPEMVSLDDLLAEEENGSRQHNGRDEDDWTFGIDPEDPLN